MKKIKINAPVNFRHFNFETIDFVLVNILKFFFFSNSRAKSLISFGSTIFGINTVENGYFHLDHSHIVAIQSNQMEFVSQNVDYASLGFDSFAKQQVNILQVN